VTQRLKFSKSKVLRGDGSFSPVFERGMKQAKGPLLVVAVPNDLGHPRLGISVPKRVSKRAVVRNRIKRLVREAFRLMQHDLPRGYDIVVVARSQEATLLADYQRLLSGLLLALHRKWAERDARGRPPEPPPSAPEAGHG
jgi:ribonuclease P protein component